jgi:ATP-binding cassette subfamily B protein
MFRKKDLNDKSFEALRSLIWKYKWQFFTVDFIRVIASAFVAFHPFFLAQLATSGNNKSHAFTYLVLLFATGLMHHVFWLGDDYLAIKIVYPMFYQMKKIAFTIFWDNKYSTFIEKPSGKVGYYINQLRTQLFTMWDSYNYGFIVQGISVPIYFALLFHATWQNSAIYFIFLVVSSIGLIVMTKPLNRAQRAFTDADSSNSGRVFDSYANFVNVFSFRAHDKEIARNDKELDEVSRKYQIADRRVINYWHVASSLVRVFLWGAILFYSWHVYDTGQIPFTSLIISITVLIDLTSQYWNIVHHFGNWNRNLAQYRETYNYLFPNQNIVREYYDDKRTWDREAPISFSDNIEISDLTFAYPDAPEHPVLKNINLKISKNEKIGIVGKSGSGKSTLVKILLGFYDIDELDHAEGDIRVDGLHIHGTDLSQLYAYVPQDTTLFQESIYYNIAYATHGEVTEEQVKDATAKAHISEFIESLPNGYETLVGERGVKLSLGQRQRVAIARAFLKHSELLILDEATSSLDSRTESYVQESFEKLWEGKSVIAIAHRLSTLNNVDRIIVMSKGEIVEEGTKEELLALNGSFADLWNHQRKGMI